MTRELASKRVFNERGVALPLAMLTLALLATLMIAFLALSKSEPVIAANHQRATEARALAESGLERALWALSASVIPSPLAGTAASPYDGTQFITLNTRGGAFVTVTNLAATERAVTSIGWSPTNGQSASHRKVVAVAMKLTDIAGQAPCALCVAGELNLDGNTIIDGRPSTCGQKYGTYTAGCTAFGSASCGAGPGPGAYGVYGGDGNSTPNQSTDYAQNVGPDPFNSFKLTAADMDVLRKLAKANGTYYQGSVHFTNSNQVKNGVVFIDTVSGNNPTPTSNPADNANVLIDGNPFIGTGGDGIFRGWIVANGTINISGNMQIKGVVYAANDLAYNGTGTGQISGLVISQNIQDTSATTIDTSTTGNSNIVYDCENARGLGSIPQGWFVKQGTYTEPKD